MSHKSQKTNFPLVRISEAKKTRNVLKLRLLCTNRYLVECMGGDVFKKLCQDIAVTLTTPTYHVSPDTIKKSLGFLLGRKITVNLLKWVCEFIGANIYEIKNNTAVLPAETNESPPEEWIPVQFTDIKKDEKQAGYIYLIAKVVYGKWYGLEIKKRINYRDPKAWPIITWKMKLDKMRHPAFPRDLVQLYAFVKLSGPYNSGFSFSKLEVNDYFANINRKLIKERQEPCVLKNKGYDIPCASCKATINQCYRATRFYSVTTKETEDGSGNQCTTDRSNNENADRKCVGVTTT